MAGEKVGIQLLLNSWLSGKFSPPPIISPFSPLPEGRWHIIFWVPSSYLSAVRPVRVDRISASVVMLSR